LQRELKKCIAEDSGLAANWISAADIEVVNPSSNAVEEHGSKSSHAEEIKKQGTLYR